MRKLLALLICVLLLSVSAEARYVRSFGSTAIAAKKAKGKSKRHRSRARKRTGKRPQSRRLPASDWDAVMRRNAEPPKPNEMLPEEYSQWFKNLSDDDLDRYLKFRVTDAIPLAVVEAEAKRRGIR